MYPKNIVQPLVVACAAVFAASVAAPAQAVMLDPRGIGQVLLYPYYTVNQHQQTLLSVVNTTDHGKLLKLEAYEAYNGRLVMDLEVFVASHDTWTATLFAPGDAGLPGAGTAITTSDASCILPFPEQWTGALPTGTPYQDFLPGAYIENNADSGPTDPARTREGWFAVYEMAEVVGTSLAQLDPPPGTPRDCRAMLELHGDHVARSGGGLYGSAAVVDVGRGTMYAYAADALADFTTSRLQNDVATLFPLLPLAFNVGDSAGGHTYAEVPIAGSYRHSDYVGAVGDYLHVGIDAVSAVLDAQAVYAEYDRTAAAGVQSEWVLTFPTKPFYTDKNMYYGRATTTPPPPPFVEWFGQTTPGKSCVRYEFTAYDREGAAAAQAPRDPLCTVTQVLTLRSAAEAAAHPASPVLDSTLTVNVDPGFASGMAVLNLDPAAEPHRLRPDSTGVQFRGLPVIGFEAINYINANVTPGVLANYSSATPLRTATGCVHVDGSACP